MTTQTGTDMDLSEEMIATRAHQRYVERGGEDGHDVEDWLAAEKELGTGLVTRPAETTSAQRPPRARATAEGTPARQ